MSDTFAEQLRSVAESYDASYPPSILGGGGSTPPPFPTTDVTPVLASMTPTTGPAGTTVTVRADDSGLFMADSKLWFSNTGSGGNIEQPTTIVNSREATFVIPAGATAAASNVQAITPGAVPNYSNVLSFTVAAAVPPVITTLTPSTVVAGPTGTITIDGSGFVADSDVVVTYENGNAVTLTTTVFVSATRLTFTGNFPAGANLIKVKNGTVESNSVTLTVTAAAGGLVVTGVDVSAIPLTVVTGSGFDATSALEVTFPSTGKAGFTPTVESDTRLTFNLQTGEVGTHQIQVVNSGTTLSNLYSFEVTTLPPPPPVLTSLTPTTAPMDGDPMTPATIVTNIAITGTGFLPTHTVYVAGMDVAIYPTSDIVLVSPTQITFDFLNYEGMYSAPWSAEIGVAPPNASIEQWSNTLPLSVTVPVAADPAQAEQAAPEEPPKPRRRGQSNGTAS